MNLRFLAIVASFLDWKLIWAIRFQFYRLLFGRLGLWGYLGPPVYIKNGHNISLGNGVGIFPHARLETYGEGRIEIGDRFRSGHNLFISSGKLVSIGEDCIFSASVFVGTSKNQFVESNLDRSAGWFNRNTKEYDVFIGRGCFVGYGAVILPGARIEEGCVIGANVVINSHIPANTIVGRNNSKRV